jgi:hypothetical protein
MYPVDTGSVRMDFALATGTKTFLVSVHALEEATVLEELRWVEKQGHCLGDRVLFLGSPNSFALNASLLGGQGGCAYFVYHNSENETPEESGLFRYSFIDGKAERIQRLPQEWEDQKCTWLVPQPTIAPIQVICTLILNTSQTYYYLSLINSINHLLYDRIKLTEQYNNVLTS